jgi:Thiolase, C-terminal domain
VSRGGCLHAALHAKYLIAGVEPRLMGIGPVVAIPKVLAHTGLNQEDIDVWEVRAVTYYVHEVIQPALLVRLMKLSRLNLRTA